MDSLLSNEGADKNYVIAGISIPSVGIRLDIYKGVSEYALLNAIKGRKQGNLIFHIMPS